MEYLKINSLMVPEDRVRKEFDDDYIANLAEDISANGLYHPLVVENGSDVLVAGQNRLLAMMRLCAANRRFFCGTTEIPLGFVPILRLSKLSKDQLLEVEINENLMRRDITWQERVAGITKLHNLRLSQNPEQKMKDTAAEVLHRPARSNESTFVVGNALALSRHMDDPEVASAPTQKAALKIVTRKIERLVVGELAALVDADQSQAEEKGQEKTRHFLALGGVLELCDKASHGLGDLDLIITDPPYGIGADKFGDQAKVAHRYEDSEADTYKLLRTYCALTAVITKPDAHLYMFCAYEWFATLKGWLEEAGWNVWHRPFVWHKGNSGMLPAPDYGPRQTYELILYARRGNKKLVKMGQQDVLSYSDSTEVEHAAQKPPELYADLIARSCLPGERVGDHFCGRGTIFTAADVCKVIAVACEKDEEMYKLAHGRMHGINRA